MKFLSSKRKKNKQEKKPDLNPLVAGAFLSFRNKEDRAAQLLQRNIRSFLAWRRSERKRIQAELKEKLRIEAIIYRRKITRDYWWEVDSDITRLTRREVEDLVARLGLGMEGATRQTLIEGLKKWLEFPAKITDIGLQAACIAADRTLQASGSVFYLNLDYRAPQMVKKGDVRDVHRNLSSNCIKQLLGKGVQDVFAGFGAETVYIRDELKHVWLAKTGSTSGSEHTGLHVPIGKSEWMKTPMLMRSTERDQVKSISLGPLHCVAVSETGDIYTWGKNPHGELGLQKKKHSMEDYLPDNVDVLAEATTRCVAAGTNHSLAVSMDGKVFGWGSKSFGQLGAHAQEFVPIEDFSQLYVMKVSSGHSHCALLTDDGSVYTWGNADGGRLGRDEFTESFTKEGPNIGRVVELDAYTAIDVCCGAWHTAVVVEEDWGKEGICGAVFTWGTGLGGQLGQGSSLKSPTPRRVDLDVSVKGVKCGSHCTAVLTEDTEVYTWGGDGAFFSEPEKVIRDASAGRIKSVACGLNFLVYCTAPVDESYYDEMVSRLIRQNKTPSSLSEVVTNDYDNTSIVETDGESEEINEADSNTEILYIEDNIEKHDDLDHENII